MKALLKSLLSRIAVALPWGARQAILEGLARTQGNYRLLQSLAREYGIDTFGTEGRYGLIQGSATDIDLFPTFLRSKDWAPRTIAFFETALERGGTYLDVGANIGLTTIPVAQDPLVTCCCFEPEPTNFRHLQANVLRTCPHANVRLFQMALFDKEGELTLEVSPNNSGDNRVRLSSDKGAFNEQAWRTVRVPARRLDDLGFEINHPLVVKIDTQGAEPFVIGGGSRVLSGAAVMAVEYWPYGMARMGGRAEELIEFAATHFVKGAITRGDVDETQEWVPIREVADRLRGALEHDKTAAVYFDLLLSK